MAGFPPETIDFLTDLRANNDRDWFHANHDRYEQFVLEPARAFVIAAAGHLHGFAPEVQAVPRVNGSILRLARDTRFRPDTTPYKDYLDLWFWAGDRRRPTSGFFLRLTPDVVAVGAGAYRFDPERVARFRALVTEPRAGRALQRAVDTVEAAGFGVHGEQLKNVPAGFDDATDRQAHLLRFKALYSGVDLPHPGVLASGRFLTWCLRRWQQQRPLHRWLVDHLG